jgi:NitT/TauT family transport system substrate-binding protein
MPVQRQNETEPVANLLVPAARFRQAWRGCGVCGHQGRDTMNRALVGFCAGMAVLASVLSGPARAADKVTFGYFPVADFLMAFIAKDQGFFDRHGVDATLQLMANNATSIPAALIGDSIQIGGTTVPVVMEADDNGLDVKLVANGGVTYDGFHAVALVVPTDSPVKTAKDLEGKTIGLTGIDNLADILLVKWLQLNGADPQKVHIVETNIQQMPDIMRAKALDGVIAIEPFMSRILAAGTGRVFAYDQDVEPVGSSTMVWAVAGSYAQAHPQTIKNIRAALDDALAYHKAHPDQDDATIAHYVPVPLAILKTLPRSAYANQVNPAQIKYLSDVMMEQKLLTKPAEAANVILP